MNRLRTFAYWSACAALLLLALLIARTVRYPEMLDVNPPQERQGSWLFGR